MGNKKNVLDVVTAYRIGLTQLYDRDRSIFFIESWRISGFPEGLIIQTDSLIQIIDEE